MRMSGATANGVIPPWEPDELGVPKASAASIILVTLVVGGIIYVGTHMPKPPRAVIPVTTVHMVQLPKPPPPKPLPKPPPPPPVPVPIPKPVPLPIIHHPVPVKTKIPVPVKHVVIHHKPPPPKHVVIRHVQPQVKPQPQPPPRPQPPPEPAFNAEAYGSAVRGPIERLVHVSRAMNMLRLQGTAYIEFELMPNGHLVFAKIYHSSGNPLIDKSALSAVERNRFPPFPGTAPKVWAVPIFIGPDGSDG
jgi:protein TonB